MKYVSDLTEATDFSVTELRVHGVGGSSPEALVGVPHVNRVAGTQRAGFYRSPAWISLDGPKRIPGRVAMVTPYLAWMLEVDLPEDQKDRIAYLDPARLRMEGMRATVEVLEALVAVEPLVLFFEDFHWADEASIDVVTELLRLTERSSLEESSPRCVGNPLAVFGRA